MRNAYQIKGRKAGKVVLDQWWAMRSLDESRIVR
jgi:hypothetical protein